MDKETGKPIIDDAGNEIKASTEFTAKEKDGTVDVTFTFSGTKLSGKSVVAFETVSFEGRKFAAHADIDDENQTVEIEEPEKPESPGPEEPKYTPDAPKTGDSSDLLLWMLIAGGALIATTSVIIILGRKKHNKRND